MFFISKGDSILVDVPLLEVYLPYDYLTSRIPGTASQYYEVVGENVRYYGVANFKAFRSETEAEEKFEETLTYPIGIASMILAHPSEIEIREMRFNKHSVYDKMIVLRFYKGDQFVVNDNIITNADNMSAITSRFESGKLTNIPPAMAADVIVYSQMFNNLYLRLPTEMLEAYAAERYRDPSNPSQKLRFSKASESKKANQAISYNMREEMMQSTTYQGISGEDINASLITATNRKNAGIVDAATIMEKIIKGEKIEHSDR